MRNRIHSLITLTSGIFALSLLAVACTPDGPANPTNPDDPGTGTPVLEQITRLPFDLAAVGAISPVDLMGPTARSAPDGHPIAAGRHFIWHKTPGVLYNVYAPANGKIVAFRKWSGGTNDYTVFISLLTDAKGTIKVETFLGHISVLDPQIEAALQSRITGGVHATNTPVEVWPALPVSVGTVLGQAGGSPVNWDWGIYDFRSSESLNPTTYWSHDWAYMHSVYDYANAAVQAQLKGLAGDWNAATGTFTARVGEPPLGKYSYDQAGTLAGSWFGPARTDGYPTNATFAPYTLDATRIMIRLQLDGLTVWGRYQPITPSSTGTNNLRPEDVTPSKGIVSYVLTGDAETGVLYARVNADGTATLETVRGATQPDPGFTFSSGAVTVHR